MKDIFTSKYQGLNAAQKKAVDTIEGPVMVVAGPGTGKTTILTLRIANILQKTDTPPEAILALTFTESGVVAMRRKLRDIIGHTAYRVPIFTFHGFSNYIIQKYPEAFPEIIGSVALGDHEPVAFIDTILKTYKGEHIVPSGKPTFYTPHILRAIGTLKQAGLTPEKYRAFLAQEREAIESSDDLVHEKGRYKGEMKAEYKTALKHIERSMELADVYEAYQKALRAHHKYDFDDMLLTVVETLKSSTELVQTLQEEYLYVMADEHQDTNTTQNQLLELIASFFENPNLFVVGDDKQAIYRFQGASTENFAHLPNRFRDVTTIALTENYRSPQDVLDSSHTLIANNAETIAKEKLVARGVDANAPIRIVEADSVHDEYAYIVDSIQKQIEVGEKPEEIVCLYRNNADAEGLHNALRNTGIPHVIHSRSNLMDHPLMWRLITLIKASVSPNDDGLLARALLLDVLNVDSIEVAKYIREAKEKRASLILIIGDRAIGKQIQAWHAIFHNESPTKAIETLISNADIVTYALKHDPVSGLKVLDALIDLARTLVAENHSARGSELLEYIIMHEKHNIRLTIAGRGVEKGKVNLMTAHQAKGLEFDVVYVTGATDKRWGKKSDRTYFTVPKLNASGTIEDERRLFYVALTRAKKEAVISYALHDIEEREQLRTQFIDELGDGVVRSHAPVVPPENRFHSQALTKPKLELEYLRELFLSEGLAVTAVNNFLTCPWKYFFQNLLRIPHTPEPHQLYGTAVHAGLRRMQDVYREQKKFNTDVLVDTFTETLTRLPIAQDDLDRFLKRGNEALTSYAKNALTYWVQEAQTEVSVSGILFEVIIDGQKIEIPLKGMLDKVEQLDDAVRVVDYKTGKSKTRNEILGETKNSNGDLIRQLAFYKLLLGRTGKRMKEAMLDFVEPNDKGVHRQEVFQIEESDMATLNEELTQVITDIYTFNFLDKKCDNTECEFCRTAEALPKE